MAFASEVFLAIHYVLLLVFTLVQDPLSHLYEQLETLDSTGPLAYGSRVWLRSIALVMKRNDALCSSFSYFPSIPTQFPSLALIICFQH